MFTLLDKIREINKKGSKQIIGESKQRQQTLSASKRNSETTTSALQLWGEEINENRSLSPTIVPLRVPLFPYFSGCVTGSFYWLSSQPRLVLPPANGTRAKGVVNVTKLAVLVYQLARFLLSRSFFYSFSLFYRRRSSSLLLFAPFFFLSLSVLQ